MTTSRTAYSVALIVVDFLLTLKAIEYVPDNLWLWRYGPRLVAHLRHDSTVSLPELEANGVICSNACKTKIPPRPRLSLKFIGIPDSARFTVFGRRMRVDRWASWLSKASYLAFWTPLLALLGAVTLTSTAQHAATWAVALGAIDFAAIATFTLVVAPVMRFSLGSFDIQYSDLARLHAIFKRRLPGMSNEKEALAVYFVGLLLVSILSYAMMFQGIFATDPRSFHFSWGASNAFSWLFYSITTASTFGDSQIQVGDVAGQIGIILQIFTGPLLVFWLISIIIDRS